MGELVALVKFGNSNRTYAYRTSFTDLKEGDIVTVQIPRGKGHKHAEFVEYTTDPKMDEIATSLIIGRVEADSSVDLYAEREKRKKNIKRWMDLAKNATTQEQKDIYNAKAKAELEEYQKLI